MFAMSAFTYKPETESKKWMKPDAACQSQSSPALKHSLLNGIFDSKWTFIYLMNVRLY